MNDAAQPQFDLKPTRVWCPKHGEPLRAQWPKGHLPATIKLFQQVCAEGSMWVEAAANAGIQQGQEVPVAAVEEVLDVRPLCCRVDRDFLLTLYLDMGIGVLKVCQLCFKSHMGTSICARERHFAHVCFECVLDRLRY
jgi:hypothetical protein